MLLSRVAMPRLVGRAPLAAVGARRYALDVRRTPKRNTPNWLRPATATQSNRSESTARPAAKPDGITDLPPDAPSRLTSASAQLPPSARRTALAFLALTKPRLSFLIVLTTTAAYALYPAMPAAGPDASAFASAASLFGLTAGTALCTAAANTLNMLYEPKSDRMMVRTRNRPIVRRLVRPSHAVLFAVVTAATGTWLLYSASNPVVAGLGLANIFLYAGVYTPLKHMSVINTWAGAVVGAIPPLMGWAAAAGEANPDYIISLAASKADPSDLFGFISGFRTLLLDAPPDCPVPDTALFGGWLLAAVLFSWQFPHFNALSHPLRLQYRDAGLRMLAWQNPRRSAAVSVRHSFLLAAVTVFALPASGTVSVPFVAAAGPASAWLAVCAVHFQTAMRTRGVDAAVTARAARALFWASVWYLPLVLTMAMLTKPGLWDGLAWPGSADDGGDGAEEENGAVTRPVG